MINLLSLNDKKIIFNEYRRRVMVVVSLAVSLLVVIAILIVGSFYVALFINQDSLQKLLQTTKEGEDMKKSDFYSAQTKNANSLINLLINDQGSLHTASSLLDRVMMAIPTGIKLVTIDAGPNKNGTWILNLSGTSKQREDLIAFIESLKKDPLFVTVDSPFANLIKKEVSEFSMVITLDPNIDFQKNVQ